MVKIGCWRNMHGFVMEGHINFGTGKLDYCMHDPHIQAHTKDCIAILMILVVIHSIIRIINSSTCIHNSYVHIAIK